MRITIDESLCVASGQCVLAAGDVFDQRDDGIAVLVDPDPAREALDRIRRAASRCPTSAIVVEE